MILYLGSLVFNAGVETGGNTPSWGTELGQGSDYKFNDASDLKLFQAMLYNAINDCKTHVFCPLGKGGNRQDDYDFVLGSLFKKIYVNGIFVPDAQFILLIIKLLKGDHHVGRRTLKYGINITFDNENVNEDCYIKIRKALGLNEKSTWFINEIYSINQDELHFTAYVLDSNDTIVYKTVEDRKRAFIKAINNNPDPLKRKYLIDDIDQPLQQIFYGAPGTGKSFKIDEMTRKYPTVRTTFHPDSDYSTFVGAYKPTMDNVDSKVVPVVLGESGTEFKKNEGTYTEKRIAYKFVKQAFLKAYLGAWKKYADKIVLQISVDAGNGEKWILKSVDDARVDAQKESFMNKEKFEKQVKDYWNKPGNDVGTQDHWRATACKWYKEKFPDVQNPTVDDCWNAIEQALNAGETISATPVTNQTYYIKKGENGNIVINNDNQGAIKDTIRDCFKNFSESDKSISIQVSIARKLKEYSDIFEDAWKELKKRVNYKTITPQFLIIEEINRGNCAQIFGDIFQLLDRQDNGFSAYPIEADSDLQQEIERAFKEEEEYKLKANIEVDWAVEGYKSNYNKRLSEDIQEGRILLLPPNLYIWATMNTSDQSLFPIDSAFKRRWDWKYIPINTRKEQWLVEAENTKYSWTDFLETINGIIYEKTSSEDKQLGFYFCKAKDNIINAETFVSKVVFYLWNDVFKDYGFDDNIFKDPDGGTLEFRKFFNFDGTINEKKVTAFMKNLNIEANGENSDDDESQGRGRMKVSFPDNTIFEGEKPIDVFMKTIDKVVKEYGLDVVKNAEIKFSGVNIIQEEGWHTDRFKENTQKKMDGYVLFINADNPKKKSELDKLSEKLNLGLTVEIFS